MKKGSRVFVGMDVHKDSISVCWVKEHGDEAESREIPNEVRAIGRLFKRLEQLGELRVCYEAGPCGYEVRRFLETMAISCEVIAPALIPRRPGDRVKTDKRDARKLARLYRAGELTAIRVPTEQEEAIRDLVRCREALVKDRTRQRHRLLKYLLRHGRVWRETRSWTGAHWQWIRSQQFDDTVSQTTFDEYVAQLDYNIERIRSLELKLAEQAQREPWKALVQRVMCLRGMDVISALTVVIEICDLRRFDSPRDLMSFVGLTPTIHASGGTEHRGSITKAGNAHVRRVLVEAAWHYRHKPSLSGRLRERCEDQPEWVVTVARKAQSRLHDRYAHLRSHGKPPQVAVVAVARELLGFIWELLVKDGSEASHEKAKKSEASSKKAREKAA
jgi:transposase